MASRRCCSLLASLLLLGVVCGCEEGGFMEEAPTAECIEVGAQCVLPSGPLGVCESTACDQGEPPPCFVCTPQH